MWTEAIAIYNPPMLGEANSRQSAASSPKCQVARMTALSVHMSQRFDRLQLISYWSTQSPLWQRMGEKLGVKNTFAIIGSGFRK